MKYPAHYSTITEALEQLRIQGFTVDFNLNGDEIANNPEEFEIVDVYRYEGASDPADESTIYALESKSGLKGVLVTSYGNANENKDAELLKKLHYRQR